MNRKTVTVTYLGGRVDIYHAVDTVSTDTLQWRLDLGRRILLIPMLSVRSVSMEPEDAP